MAYLADRERVLLPLDPVFAPALAARLVSAIATAKHAEGELFDVTELTFVDDSSLTRSGMGHDGIEASSSLSHAADFEHVEPERVVAPVTDLFTALQTAAEGQHLVAIGTHALSGDIMVSFGDAQDRVLREISADVLLVVEGERPNSAGSVQFRPHSRPDQWSQPPIGGSRCRRLHCEGARRGSRPIHGSYFFE